MKATMVLKEEYASQYITDILLENGYEVYVWRCGHYYVYEILRETE